MEKKQDLAKAQELADWVIINSKDDEIVANEVTTKLQSVSWPLEDAWMKLEVRQNCVKDALLRSQTPQDSLDDFIDRIAEIEEHLGKEKPISAKFSVAKEQQLENEVFPYHFLFSSSPCFSRGAEHHHFLISNFSVPSDFGPMLLKYMLLMLNIISYPFPMVLQKLEFHAI